MKRQRLKSPAGANVENDEHGRRTTVMPMFLCIPMLLLAFATQSQIAHGNMADGGDKQRYRTNSNRSVAPSRPANAVDIDYGGVHPFDEHRHSYDPAFASEEQRQHGLRRSLIKTTQTKTTTATANRKLKKDEDKDKDKDKEKEEDDNAKWDNDWDTFQEEEQKNEKETEEPTKRPTDRPTKEPTDAPVQTQNNVNVNVDKDAQVLAFENAEGASLIFEGVDTTSFNIAAATTNSEGTGANDNTQTSFSVNHVTTTLDPSKDHLYQPLRIQFDTRQLAQQMDLALSAGDAIAATKLYLLIYEILPMTARVWGDILRVVPVSGGIYPLAARGSGVDQLLPNGQSNEGDATTGDDPEDVYNNDPVRSMYCPDETTSGIEGGADLLIYATVNRHCAGSGAGGMDSDENTEGLLGTLASALSCQRDQYDRPITGSIDFCLEGMKGVTKMTNVASYIARKDAQNADNSGGNRSKSSQYMVGGDDEASFTWDGFGSKEGATNGGAGTEGGVTSNEGAIQYSVGVAVHEIGHVLGVTSDSLAYFRHPLTGHPLTRRPFEVSTVTCVNGQNIAYVGMPGPAVLQEARHEGTGNRHFEVVTPTVQRVVRNHFNCPTMMGARLENQPTSTDCFGSHFDEMLYYTEIMGAVFSQSVNILSPLTLALLEDSGWYRANYQSTYVKISMFGHGAGCDFIENNCIDSNGNIPPEFTEHFCNTPISIRSDGLIAAEQSGSQTCDPSHTQKTYCDLVNINEVVAIGKTGNAMEPAPEKFQYLSDPNYRPYSFTNADYCPVPHLDPKSCIKNSGQNQINEEMRLAGEYYGTDSRCVETDGTRRYSLCLQTRCNPRLGKVQLTAGGVRRTCQYDGQVHTIEYNENGAGELRIKCPKAALVCPELFCPANCAGRGDCIYASDVPYGEDNDIFFNTRAQAKCVCDSDDDTSAGCYGTNLTFPAVYGHAYENPNKANKTMFLIIVGSLIVGLAVMFVAVRQWKARQNVFM